MSSKYDDLRLGDCLGTSLHDAAHHGNKRQVKKIIKKGIHVDYPNSRGQTALYVACSEGHEDIVTYLLKKGADPNVRTDDGSTPVHAAGLGGSTRIVIRLIEAGGDLRLHDKNQRTINEWAATICNVKKRKKMQNFMNKIRTTAMTHCGRDALFERQSSSFYSSLHEESTLGSMFKGKAAAKTFKGISLQNLGFGKVCYNNDSPIGALATIPLVKESSLKHDQYGFSYNNGPFMVMESMNWKCTQVTVKRLHRKPPEGGLVDLLIRENQYMSTLRHPSILLLMGVCQTNQLDDLVLLYERVGCGSLYHYLYQKAETFAVWSMCELLRQVCDAVVYLHERNLIHTNISSHSIHVISPTLAKLGNFEYIVENSGMCPDGTFPKTDAVNNKYSSYVYNWLAPEVMDGESPTESSDLYSLCVVIWEILNGCLPWRGLDADEIKCEVVDKRNCLPVDRDKIESPFDIILQQGLSVFPGNRLITVEKLRDHMARVVVDREHISISQRSITPYREIDDVCDLSISRLCEQTTLDISNILNMTSKTLTPTPAPRRSRSSTPSKNMKRTVSDVQKKEWTPDQSKKDMSTGEGRPQSAERRSIRKATQSLQSRSELSSQVPVQVGVVATETIAASSSSAADMSEVGSGKTKRKKRRSKDSGEKRRSWGLRKEKNAQEQINDVVASDSDGPKLVAISTSSLNKQAESSPGPNKKHQSPGGKSEVTSSLTSAVTSSMLLHSAARKSLFQGAIPFRVQSARTISSSVPDVDKSDKDLKASQNASTTSSSLLTMPPLTSTSTTQESQENTISTRQDISSSNEKVTPAGIVSPGSDNPFKDKQLTAEAESTLRQLLMPKANKHVTKISKTYSALSAAPHRKILGPLEKNTVYGALSRQDISGGRWHRSPTKEGSSACCSRRFTGLGGDRSGLQRQSAIFSNLQAQLEEGRAPTSADILPPHLKTRSMIRRPSWVMESQPVSHHTENVKPASHRYSLEGSPSKLSSTDTTQSICSLDNGEIVWQDATDFMAGITQSADRQRIMPRATMPCLADARHRVLQGAKPSWQKYRSETFLDITGRRGFSLDLHNADRCLSSASLGTRCGAEGEVITSAGGSIKDLIKTFQDHEMQHKRKQSILTLKKAESKGPAPVLIRNFKSQPSCSRHQMVQTEEQNESKSKKNACKALAEILVSSTKVESEPLQRRAAPDESLHLKRSQIVEDEIIPGCVKKSRGKETQNLEDEVPTVETREGISSVSVDAQDLVDDVLADLTKRLNDEGMKESLNMNSVEADVRQRCRRDIGDDDMEADHISYHSSESEDGECGGRQAQDEDEDERDAGEDGPAADGGKRGSNVTPDPDDFYFDDVISPDLYNQRYMRLQTTIGLNGSELDTTPDLTPIRTASGAPYSSFLPTTEEEDNSYVRDQHSQGDVFDAGSRYRGPHTFPAEPETMTLTKISPASSATAGSDDVRIIPSGDTVTIEKVVDVNRDRGSNTQLKVSSRDDGSCVHTISCSKTDMTTGTTVTTHKKITAHRVITKVVALDDSFTEV